MFKRVISTISLMLLATGCLNNSQPTGTVSTTQTVNVGDYNYVDQYKSVINAYIGLEQSGYTSYDESILGDDVCLIPNGDGSYFIGYDTKPSLMYAFYDLNGNGIPELLIGADLGEADGAAMPDVFITGIYGLQDGKPVSLIQVDAWSQLNVFSNNSDISIIKITSGTHIEYVAEKFYMIDEKETLITLNKLYTYGKINDYYEPDDIIYSHTKDVDGKEVSITEQEYFALMQKYGSVGYLNRVGDLKDNEIVIDSWKPLTAY
ncbi:hypothetical protein [Lacrimispora brassicae]